MDYEKLHKDTINKLQQMVNSGKITVETARGICADFVPDSEDEKIRNFISNELACLRAEDEKGTVRYKELTNAIAWLEKQGENNMGISEATKQKLEDNLNNALEKETAESWNKFLDEQGEQKPTDKFHEGDWVVISTSDGEKVVQIDSIEYFKNGKPRYITSEGRWFSNGTEARLWNIAKDAKDGDVLVASDGSIFIFKGTINCACKHYIALATDGAIEINEGLKHYWETSRAVHPATKEQRDTLMKAMADAGYTFNFEKKELKEIVSPIFHIGDRVRYKGHVCDGVITEITDTDYICGNAKLPISTQDKLELVEQNHACSDVDDKMYNNLTEFEKAVKQVMEEAIECGDTHNLKADADMLLRLVQKSAWSEEDIELIDNTIKFIEDSVAATPPSLRTYSPTLTGKEIPFLKSLKDRVQPKQEWSEEEEKMIQDIINDIAIAQEQVYCKSRCEDEINWLKSLKERYTWRPSYEQMDALHYVTNFDYGGHKSTLVSLYEQLKKLK